MLEKMHIPFINVKKKNCQFGLHNCELLSVCLEECVLS